MILNKQNVELGEPYELDQSAIVGYPATRLQKTVRLVLGRGARIRSGCVVYMGSTIGERLELGHNVVLREENLIGDDVSVWSNSIIDYGCTIGNRVKIHCNCYVAQYSVIEDDAFLAPGVTIANDLYPGVKESKELMRGPRIGRGAQVGVNATLLPYVEVGDNAIVGAGSVVTKSVPAGAIVAGNPARVVRASYSKAELEKRLRERIRAGRDEN